MMNILGSKVAGEGGGLDNDEAENLNNKSLPLGGLFAFSALTFASLNYPEQPPSAAPSYLLLTRTYRSARPIMKTTPAKTRSAPTIQGLVSPANSSVL